MTFAAAVAIAVSFWGARMTPQPSTTPCNIRPVVMEDDALAVAAGGPALAAVYGPDSPQCGLIMESRSLRFWQQQDPGYFCSVIVHEVGHVYGLNHTPGGIMQDGGIPQGQRRAYPWPCRKATRPVPAMIDMGAVGG